MNNDQIQQELQRLREENAKLKASVPTPKLGIKVSPKGAVSVYGLQRFPVTLYAKQWRALAERMPSILAFVEEHKGALTGEASETAEG